jgi:hypothetical protein
MNAIDVYAMLNVKRRSTVQAAVNVQQLLENIARQLHAVLSDKVGDELGRLVFVSKCAV